jgi:hypothetical protein
VNFRKLQAQVGMKACPLAGVVDLCLGPSRQPLPVYVGMLLVAASGLVLSIVQYMRSVADEPTPKPRPKLEVVEHLTVCKACRSPQHVSIGYRESRAPEYEGEIGRRYNRDGSVSIEFD